MPSFTGRPMGHVPARRRRRGSRRHPTVTAAPRPAPNRQRTGPHWLRRILLLTTRIYARDGVTLLEERYQQRRTVVPLNEMSWDLRHATISIEDKDFYNHGAVNPVRMVAAGVYDLLHQRAAQGGSTITQQLVKNYLLSGSAASRSLDRKARELVLSIQLERQYTKDQILEMYLNTIFYGNQSFGVEAAAQTYFGTSARQLDLAQSA